MRAWIALAEFPAARFTGTVVRTANAIDQNTRTLLTEWMSRTRMGAYCRAHTRKCILTCR